MQIAYKFTNRFWDESCDQSTNELAIETLEQGSILLFPYLNFQLQTHEEAFLTPHVADPHSKNVSFCPNQQRLWGVQRLSDDEHFNLKLMLDRYSRYALSLIRIMFPSYANDLQIGRTSFRPVQIGNRKTSYRKDDKRLHVDAFPSAPNQGKRILRVFTNINPNDKDRIWRVGEPFEMVADQFLPKIGKPFPGSFAAFRFLRITKSFRTLYDHYMLRIHDHMKADLNYQKYAKQELIHFASNTSWIVQTDHVSHAAMEGQYVLEQTFYLPVHAMKNELHAPLRILERKLKKRLV